MPATAVATAAAEITCPAGKPWSEQRGELSLTLCFDPYPPKLGVPGAYEAILLDAQGQPVPDATVQLILVGGMAGMEGEHDEDFSAEFAPGEPGRYRLQATIGPTDLELTTITVAVKRGSDSETFSIPPADL